MTEDLFDVLIVGGGPAGLQAALTLGRARKRVLLMDGGPRRNAPTAHMNNFVSRDGIAPLEFRREARAQLAKYPNVSLRDEPVGAITGARGDFRAGTICVLTVTAGRRRGTAGGTTRLMQRRRTWAYSSCSCAVGRVRSRSLPIS
jgi:thioredoxin reductase